MKRMTLVAAAVLFLAATVVATVPEDGFAQGNRGGRIYNPKRLRPRPERASRGRILRDPRKAPTTPRQPARRRALIPNPEPQERGGSGYTKRGKYYYQDPKPIRAGGNSKRRVDRITIPHPNKKYR